MKSMKNYWCRWPSKIWWQKLKMVLLCVWNWKWFDDSGGSSWKVPAPFSLFEFWRCGYLCSHCNLHSLEMSLSSVTFFSAWLERLVTQRFRFASKAMPFPRGCRFRSSPLRLPCMPVVRLWNCISSRSSRWIRDLCYAVAPWGFPKWKELCCVVCSCTFAVQDL